MTKTTAAQRQAIETQGRAIVVDAGAGTGKTWVLVERFLHLLDQHQDWPLESLVAVTFTEKATREMRSRIREAVEKAAAEAPLGAHWHGRRLVLERLQISTIHGLCARLLRENAIAAKIDPLFTVLDEQETDLLKEQAIQQTLAKLVEEDSPTLALLGSLRIYDLRIELAALLQRRGTVQRLFAELQDPKTLLARWRVGMEDMRRTVWAEIQRDNPQIPAALDLLPTISISDPDDKLAPSVALAQAGCRLIAAGEFADASDVWSQIALRGGRKDRWGGSEALSELKELLRAVRSAGKTLEKTGCNQVIGEEDEGATQTLHLWRDLFLKLNETYKGLKYERQALDFDDLELEAAELLSRLPRPPRLQATLDGINHLLVDEFQDTNEIQGQIVYAIAPPEAPGRLFVVGDAKQSIYRFRQAQVSVFNRTKKDIYQATGQLAIPLNQSFRSQEHLLGALNNLFHQILKPAGDKYEIFEAQPGPLHSLRNAHPQQESAPAPVELMLLPAKTLTEKTINAEEARIFEAQLLAQRLLDLEADGIQVWDKKCEIYRRFQFGDAVILFRATTNLPIYEAEFKKAGLPYLTVSGRGYYDRPEVLDLLALLACLYNPSDDLSLATVLRSPLFNLSDETLYRLRWRTPKNTLAEEPIPYAEALANPPPTDQADLVDTSSGLLKDLWDMTGRVEVWGLLRKALDRTGYETIMALSDLDEGGGGRQLRNVQKFLEIAQQRSGLSLPAFLRRMQDLRAREAREGEALGGSPDSSAVQLMSIHAAKGLEFPVVAVADLGREKRGGFGTPRILHDPAFGIVCKYRDKNGDWQEPASYQWGKWTNARLEVAENKRLLYVACTRAADLLILSGKLGKSGTWLHDILQAWNISVDGDDEEIISHETHAIRVLRPSYEPPSLDEFSPHPLHDPGLDQIPPLARRLPKMKQTRAMAVTQLAQILQTDNDPMPDVRPVVWAQEGAERVFRAPAYLIGRVVHRALADWECVALPSDNLYDRVAAYAQRDGIASPEAIQHAAARSIKMLGNLKQAPLYTEICDASQRYPELPFTLTTPLGTLHGVIDLLYEDIHGEWHIIDWKTEWVPKEQVEEHAQDHINQLAIYAEATQKTLGIAPKVALCFLYPSFGQYLFQPDELDAARAAMYG